MCSLANTCVGCLRTLSHHSRLLDSDMDMVSNTSNQAIFELPENRQKLQDAAPCQEKHSSQKA